MEHQNGQRCYDPWVWLGVGLLAAGIGVGVGLLVLRRRPDHRARRLIAGSERLIEQISVALDELKQQSAAVADGR